MIGVILYVFFVVISANKNYLNNKNVSIFPKIVNIIITFFIYVFFFSELRSIFVEVISGNFFPERIKYTLLLFKMYYVLLSYYAYFIICLFMCVISINFARGQERGRKNYFKLIFVIIVVVSNFFILTAYNMFGPDAVNYIGILLIASVVFVIFYLLLIIYKSKFMDKIFHV